MTQDTAANVLVEGTDGTDRGQMKMRICPRFSRGGLLIYPSIFPFGTDGTDKYDISGLSLRIYVRVFSSYLPFVSFFEDLQLRSGTSLGQVVSRPICPAAPGAPRAIPQHTTVVGEHP
jgi:hypothetical protein